MRAAPFLVTLLLATGLGRATRAEFGSPGFELHDVSAWTLRDGELEVAPEALRIGLLDGVELASSVPLALIGAPNAELKATIHASGYLAVGARAGFVYFDPDFVGIDTDFDLLAVPVAFEVSGRPIESVRVHASVDYLVANPDTRAPDLALRIQRYLGPVGRLAMTLGGEYRFSRHVGVLARLALPLIPHRDAFLYAGEGDDVGAHLRVEAAMHLVYDSFNLRLGVGFGPSLLGRSGVFPILGLAFRVF
ncbi:MAG: hypothetical protein IT385_11520 [Deltaproteobacteria bacterium]|nr:hypothetical protein [Deltaproteobacteria bacterium]